MRYIENICVCIPICTCDLFWGPVFFFFFFFFGGGGGFFRGFLVGLVFFNSDTFFFVNDFISFEPPMVCIDFRFNCWVTLMFAGWSPRVLYQASLGYRRRPFALLTRWVTSSKAVVQFEQAAFGPEQVHRGGLVSAASVAI